MWCVATRRTDMYTYLLRYGLEDYQSISKTRHEASDSDGLATYTWTHFVPGEGGAQTLLDPINNLNLTTSYVVLPGEGGEAWAARISGQPIDADKRSRNALLWYTGVDGYGHITMEDEENPLSWTGQTPDLGPFAMSIRTNKGSVPEADHPGFSAQPPESWSSASSSFSSHADVSYAAVPVPVGSIWQAKEAILQQLLKSAQETLASYGQGGPFPDPATVLHLPDDVYTSASLWAIQLNFDGPFEFDISFTPGKESTAIAAPALTAALDIVKAKYETVFADVFPTDELHAKFSKEITANLLGGVGYFHGTSLVDRSFRYDWDEEEAAPSSGEGPELTEPRSLLTATPSRSFFPRGFYWDEGFHLLPIARLFPSLAAEILESWVGLIDEDGWVGREQILGEEARSRVPAEFQVQVPNYGNPPTLVMAVQALLQAPSTGELSLEDLGMGGQVPLGTDASRGRAHDLSPEERTTILRRLYPALKRHYDWFRRTQRGLLRPYGRRPRSRTEAYRWRGRSPTHVLTSGMDDYPRPDPPSQGELHLDLLSWMAFFSRTMAELAETLGGAYEDDAESYRMVLRGCLDNLHDLHWSEEDEAFCDASVDEDDEHVLVCNKGYLTLFPFMLELLGEGGQSIHFRVSQEGTDGFCRRGKDRGDD